MDLALVLSDYGAIHAYHPTFLPRPSLTSYPAILLPTTAPLLLPTRHLTSYYTPLLLPALAILLPALATCQFALIDR